MKHFFSSLIVLAALSAGASLSSAQETKEIYELRIYKIESEEKAALFDRTAKEALMPAMKRIGVGPVGVFKIRPDGDGKKKGGEMPVSHRMLLIPHKDLESVGTLGTKLEGDADFGTAASEYLSVEKSNAVYSRVESSLLVAFDGWKKLVVPKPEAEAGKRFFELRIYESHSEMKGKLKVEMFNKGEIDIFNRVGLKGVFYAETLVGANAPNLTYMLAYDDEEKKAGAWKAFSSDPAWKELKTQERYKDTVSKIVNYFLLATDYSQIK